MELLRRTAMTESEFRNSVLDLWQQFVDADPTWRLDMLARILSAEMAGIVPPSKYGEFFAAHNAAVLQYISYLTLPQQGDTIN
jgi:hypothetical protein